MKLWQFVMVGLISIFLAACNQAKQESSTEPAAELASVAEVTSPPEDISAPMTSVAENVALKFPHLVRSRTEETIDGVARNTLRVEYKERDEVAVAAELETAFVSAGYKVKADGLKFVAFGEKLKVRYVISPAGPDLKVNLSSPESKGLITFMW